MTIEFIKSGLQTSIQDHGFCGHMQNGISKCGSMDPFAMKMANWLVSKSLESAVLEITLIGPTLIFHTELTVAICGASFEMHLNDLLVENNQSLDINPGDILRFGKLSNGARAYLAFSGALELDKLFKSHSTNIVSKFGGFKGRAFADGDILSIVSSKQTKPKRFTQQSLFNYSNHLQIRVTSGIEKNWFSKSSTLKFLEQIFTVSPQSNRMGIRLHANPIQQLNTNQLVSTGISQGTIQVPSSGQPIITSVEGQTIGGYPRIANIISADLHLLGQLKAGDRISFQKITVEDAHYISIEKNTIFKKIFG